MERTSNRYQIIQARPFRHVHDDNPRLTVERLSTDCLDVRELHRADLFRHRELAIRLSLRWPGIVQMRTSPHLIQIELRNQLVPQIIRISWTRCHYGGFRPWLHCPYCDGRAAKLLRGLAGYGCRRCVGNPVYATQRKSTDSRRHFQACKLRLRLGGVASLTAPFPERPSGMHRRTYLRLRHHGEQLEAGLSERLRNKPADYANLGHYCRLDFQMI
jgi:hypothetical protein